MQKRNKKSWAKLAARVTLGLLVAGSTLGWAQGASAEVETKFKVTGWTDGKPVCDTSASGFGQIKYEIKNYEPMLYGKMDWALSNPTDPIFEVYYASTGGDPLKYTDLGKAVLCGSYAKDATYSANNSKVVVTAGKLASVIGANMIGTGKAEGNIVEISGTAAIADSIGGAVSNGEANNNKVKIDNVNLDTELVCGASLRNDKGSATENEVEIIGGNVKIKEISGAYAFPVNYANVSRNSVTVKNAVLGAYSRGSSKKIEISGASTASSREDGSYTGKAEYNSVVLENVKVGADSYLCVYGGFGGESVIYNHVTIKDSEIVSAGNSDIIGGFTYGGDVKYNVNYNTVTIENSKVKGNVYAATAGAYGVTDVKASAIGNQIILKGNLDLKEAILYGVDKAELAKGHNSNALILNDLTGTNNSTEVRAVRNFNYIQFNTVNLTSENSAENAYLKLSNDVESKFLDEKTYLKGAISGTGYLMTGYFDGSKLDVSDLKDKFLGGSSVEDYLTGNGVKLLGYDVKVGSQLLKTDNYVIVEKGTNPIALAGVYTDGSGTVHKNTGDSTPGTINVTSAPASTVKIIAGAYNVATDSDSAKAVNGKATVSNIQLDNSTNQTDKQIKLYGGYSVNGGAENNQLILNNLSYNSGNYLKFYGNYATKGDIKSEITAVEVSGGKVYDIYGNYSNLGGNIIGKENVPVVKLTNVTYCGTITGARIQTLDNSDTYKIENNEVLIQYDGSNSGTGAGSVIGTEGFSNYIAKNNKVTIDGKFTVNNITGVQQSKEADGNTVTVRNGAVVNNKVYGVYLGEESASNNKVIINNATVKELVVGASANVKATGNAVEISNGSKVGSVRGVNTGDAENNTVFVSGSSVTAEVVGHHYKATATEKNDLVGKKNTIEISNSDVDGNVVGAMIISTDLGSVSSQYAGQLASTLAGTLTENSVTIIGTSEVKNATDRYVAGAYINKEYTGVASGDVVKNTVTIKDGAKVAPVIYGGYTVKGNAESNRVTVQDNAQVTGTIYGNYSMDGNATGDGEHANVSISGGAKFSNTYGGYSKNGQANSNIVQITGEGTTYTGSWGIFGGYSEKEGGEANSNKVVVNGGASISNVFGGSASVASGNIVTIGTAGDTTTVVNGDIRGAGGINLSKNEVNLLGGSINRIWGAFGTIVSENTVTISGGAIRGEYSDGYIIGGEAESFSGDTDNIASNNVVNISAGNFNANVAGNVASSGSGIAKGDGTRANVSISGGTVNGNVYGGAGGIAENNIVSISGGTVTGKYAGVIGGSGTTVSDNKISISGGIINSKVTGGEGNNSFKYNTSDLTVNTIINSTVSGNIVEISGGTLGGEQKSDIYAGYSESKTSYKGDAVAKGNIKDNKIIITKGENLNVATSLVNANLYGSNLAASETSGNTLDVSALTDATSINSINNFNTIVMGTGQLTLGAASDLSNTVVDLSKLADKTTARTLISGNLTIDNLTFSGISKAGEVGYNKVNDGSVSGGVFKYVSGGAKATAEKITIEAGEAGNNIAGLYIASDGKKYSYADNTSGTATSGTLKLGDVTVAEGKTYAGAYAEAGDATGGAVEISGAVNGAIYAGYTAGTGAVSGNTINITGTANVAAADLYGGNGSNVNGNTLNLADWTADTKKIQSVNGFATINLGTVNGVNITNASNLNGTTITVSNTVGAGELISGNFAKEGITVTGFNSVASTEDYSKDGNSGVTPVSGLSSKIETNAAVTTVSLVNEASKILAGSYVDAQGVAHDAANKTLVLATTPSDKTELAGAYAVGSQAATGGTVNITGNIGTADSKATVYAGYSENGTVSGNTVKLTGSADASNVNIVGSNKAFDANANNVLDITGWTAASKTINSVDKINSISFGDVALNSTASYLTINGAINGGSLNGTVITAGNLTGEGDLISGISTKGVNVEALKGEAGKDKVTALSNGVQYAVGGGTEVTVNANSIHVKANAPDTVKAVAGVFYGDDGKPEKGNTNGVLTLDGTVTPVEGVIYAGAYAKTGNASGGTVKLTGDFNGTVYGGYSADGSGAENNTLEIDGSKSVTVKEIKAVDTINITGEVAKNGEKPALNVTNKADFTKTNVNIAGLDLEGAVKDTTKYNVISNAVVNAAKVAIDGLVTKENNVVKANIVNKDVTNGLSLTYGGKVVTGSYTDEAGTVTANGGVLKVSDIGKVEDGVIYAGAYNATGNASGIVELDNSFAGTLYGGYQAADKKGSGTLNVRGAGLTVKETANFDTINFFVPATLAKGETMLKVDSDVNIAGAKVNAGIHNQSALDVGDEITLLEAVSLNATGIVAGKVTENDFVDYDMNIEAANNQLKAKITSKGISNENSKSPVETIAGGLVMLNMGADQLAGKGFENAAEAVSLEKATAPNTMTTFASVGGNKVKAKTGSHVDLKGWNFNMGLAKEIDNKAGKLLLAPVAEYGRGSYDSYIEGAGKTVHADGSSKYWGAGVMARQTNDSGFYYEGSLVGGKSTNDYSTKDIGTGISYDTSAMYMTAHLGAGKIVELGEKDKLNYYGKFFYSRLGSDDVTLSNGAKYSFDASESKRMRLGGRWTRELNAMSKLYAGMAWQYEFDAESRATVNGKTAQAPTMKGHTGILELGWNVKPDNAKFDIDMSFLGYTGKQKGGSLNVNMNWKF